ncbi:zf-HC2 domain-containing protein [Streptacidiphilus cavernicola]|uniref:Zf-HC2 domain-containing protein n=1 Tax=Streptacidiphilus cavernicola TaxID=3342716 RepID=A0ABV6VNH1_9ACTN
MTGPLRPGTSGAARPESAQPDHDTLRGLLGAWALNACTGLETAWIEIHLAECPSCADEGGRLRDAAGWLSADEPLEPAPDLRSQVLTRALTVRPARIKVPDYSSAYVAETARLDALLRDLGESDWIERADLVWHGGAQQLRPAEVLSHLTAVDGVVSRALGLADPVPPAPGTSPEQAGSAPVDLVERTSRLIEAQRRRGPDAVRSFWREQTRALVETAALAESQHGAGAGDVLVDYGAFRLPLRDAFVDRAFECWIHADDVAEAVGWPYGPPRGVHIRTMVDLATRLLPSALNGLREAGLASLTSYRKFSGSDPGYGDPRGVSAVKLIIEGRGESEWLVPLEPLPPGSGPLPADIDPVATLAIDGVEFCFLCAAHRDPDRMPCGITGDRAAARDLLHAARLLSRP